MFMTATPPDRCRLVLITPPDMAAGDIAARFAEAIAGGDVASVIVAAHGTDEVSLQALAEKIVPVAQAAGIAAIIDGDTRVAGRVGADGVHVEVGREDLADAIDRLQARMIVGTGGATTRDAALELGEAQPDYVFFGRFGFDNKPEPHRRNLALATGWAEMVEVPCIVLAGADVESVAACAATGAEFVALSAAVFGSADAAAAVRRANAILEGDAPPTGAPA
jgi:thiamine-phosphate pyrophosphorylase